MPRSSGTSRDSGHCSDGGHRLHRPHDGDHLWCSDPEIRALIRDGEIADGIRLSALLLAGLGD